MMDDAKAQCPFLHGATLQNQKKPTVAEVSVKETPPGSCPYGFGSDKVSSPVAQQGSSESKCPFGYGEPSLKTGGDNSKLAHELDALAVDGHGAVEEQARIEAHSSAPKCPLGYDADNVKVGPLTCLVCKSLLFNTVRILPCRHMFCNSCCVRLPACGLCGGERKSIEQDDETRALDQNVHYFIEKYARRQDKATLSEKSKGQQVGSSEPGSAGAGEAGPSGQDLSLEQGGLLLQLAMRAYAGRNNVSALHLLNLCEEDLKSVLKEEGMSTKVLCQLGAVTAARGDVSRSADDPHEAASAYRDSATWLEFVEEKNAEVVHDLSVAYNKLGDLHLLAKSPERARDDYLRALELRQNAYAEGATASQVLDLVVSFTKVADLDRDSKKDKAAVAHFREGAKLAAELGQKRDTYSGAIEQKRLSLLEFICSQLRELEPEV